VVGYGAGRRDAFPENAREREIRDRRVMITATAIAAIAINIPRRTRMTGPSAMGASAL